MYIYFFSHGIVTSLFLISLFTKNKKTRTIEIFALVLIISLFCGLRGYERWTDWNLYQPYYNRTGHLDHDFEIGFAIWNKMFQFFHAPYFVYLIVSYFISLSLIYLSSKDILPDKYRCYPVFALFNDYILSSGGFKQFLSCCIYFYSIKYAVRGENKKYIALCILATMIHRSAIIGIFILFIFKWYQKSSKKNEKRWMKAAVILAIVGFIINATGSFIILVTSLIDIMTKIPFLSSVRSRLIIYLPTIETDVTFNFSFLKKCCLIIIFFYILHNSRKLKENKNFRDKYKIIFSLYYISFVLSLFMNGIFGRMFIYFVMMSYLLEPLALESIRSKKNRYVLLLLFIVMHSLSFYRTLTGKYYELFVPYRN